MLTNHDTLRSWLDNPVSNLDFIILSVHGISRRSSIASIASADLPNGYAARAIARVAVPMSTVFLVVDVVVLNPKTTTLGGMFLDLNIALIADNGAVSCRCRTVT